MVINIMLGVHLPGVIKCVPFSWTGIAAIGSVVTTHRGAWVVGHCIKVIHRIYCKKTDANTKLDKPSGPPAKSTDTQNSQHFTLLYIIFGLIWKKKQLNKTALFSMRSKTLKSRTTKINFSSVSEICPRDTKLNDTSNIFLYHLDSALTTIFRGKLPQVKVLRREINKGGQLAGSSRLREAFQVWYEGESRNKSSHSYSTFIYIKLTFCRNVCRSSFSSTNPSMPHSTYLLHYYTPSQN